MLLINTYIVFLALWKALTFSSSVRELFSLGSILILQMQSSAYLINYKASKRALFKVYTPRHVISAYLKWSISIYGLFFLLCITDTCLFDFLHSKHKWPHSFPSEKHCPEPTSVTSWPACRGRGAAWARAPGGWEGRSCWRPAPPPARTTAQSSRRGRSAHVASNTWLHKIHVTSHQARSGPIRLQYALCSAPAQGLQSLNEII